MYIDGNTMIQLASLLGALGVMIGVLVKILHFVERQKAQDNEIAAIKEELSILTFALLGGLESMQAKGFDGPIEGAIEKIKNHMNAQAHK